MRPIDFKVFKESETCSRSSRREDTKRSRERTIGRVASDAGGWGMENRLIFSLSLSLSCSHYLITFFYPILSLKFFLSLSLLPKQWHDKKLDRFIFNAPSHPLHYSYLYQIIHSPPFPSLPLSVAAGNSHFGNAEYKTKWNVNLLSLSYNIFSTDSVPTFHWRCLIYLCFLLNWQFLLK